MKEHIERLNLWIRSILLSLWYDNNKKPRYQKMLLFFLLPFSFIYYLIITLRRQSYLRHQLGTQTFKVPIIVVGNITVGGTGKTPFVMHLVSLLRQQGYKPGIVSRGYRGRGRENHYWVNAESDPKQVGDEPVLLAQRLQCPLVVARKRPLGVEALLDTGSVNVVISDDGLQHYALGRDIEIALLDSEKPYGNGYCLPAGPLREPITRLKSVDFVMRNGEENPELSQHAMTLKAIGLYNGADPKKSSTLDSFKGQTVHAVAGIGQPERFFTMLEKAGIEVIRHPYPDHHDFTREDIVFLDEYPVLLTEKDAVKCQGLLQFKHWVVQVEAQVDPAFDEQLLSLLQEKRHG